MKTVKNFFLFIISALLIIPGFGYAKKDNELSSKFNKPEHHELFIKRLGEKGIDFRVGKDGRVFYPASEGEEVNKIFKSVLGLTNTLTNKGATVPISKAPEIAAALVSIKIPFEVTYKNETSIFTWSRHLDSQAMDVVKVILYEKDI